MANCMSQDGKTIAFRGAAANAAKKNAIEAAKRNAVLVEAAKKKNADEKKNAVEEAAKTQNADEAPADKAKAEEAAATTGAEAFQEEGEKESLLEQCFAILLKRSTHRTRLILATAFPDDYLETTVNGPPRCKIISPQREKVLNELLQTHLYLPDFFGPARFGPGVPFEDLPHWVMIVHEKHFEQMRDMQDGNRDDIRIKRIVPLGAEMKKNALELTYNGNIIWPDDHDPLIDDDPWAQKKPLPAQKKKKKPLPAKNPLPSGFTYLTFQEQDDPSLLAFPWGSLSPLELKGRKRFNF